MEIICPNCLYSRDVPEEKLPARAAVATCPKCKQKFKFRDLPADDGFLIESPATGGADGRASDESQDDLAQDPSGTQPDDAIPTGPSEDSMDDIPTGVSEPREPTAQDVWQRLESMTPPGEMPEHPAGDPADESPNKSADDPHAAPDSASAPPAAEREPPTPKTVDATPIEPEVSSETIPETTPPPPAQAPQDFLDAAHPLRSPSDPLAQEPETGAAQDAWQQPPLESTPPPHGDDMPEGDDIRVEVPWEHTDKYGFFPGLTTTVKRAMFSAPLFFRTMPMAQNIIKPLSFAVLLNLFAFLCEYGWDFLGLPSLWLETNFNAPGPVSAIDFLMILAILPAGILLGVLLNVMVMHLLLMLVGAAKSGFEGTFRAVCYGSAPMVLNIVPYVGPVVAMGWSLVITFIAYKHIHRTSFARLALALALPVVFIFGALLLFGSITPTDIMNR